MTLPGMSCAALAGTLLLAVLTAGCQNRQHGSASSAIDDLDGLGPVHHPVSTKNPAAQRAFDKGLARIYGFNHDAALIEFKKCAELDPECAMAYWGQALAVGPNYNLPEVDPQALSNAYAAVQEAKKRAGGASRQDRDYIEAVARRYSNDARSDKKQLLVDYAMAMASVSRTYPDDLDAATLYAESMMNLRPWKLYTSEGDPEDGTNTIVSVLENVLARDENHIGANHYYIHAVEASRTPQRAMPSAKRLPSLAPKQGHLVHMPAHVYIRTGDYAAAIQANVDAVKADDQYFACCHPSPKGIYPTLYYNHNIHFLMGAACMANRSKEAMDAARRVAENVKPLAKEVPLAEPFTAMPYLVMVRFARWDEILAEPAPDPAEMPTGAAGYHFARAIAFAAKGEVAKARTEQGRCELIRAKLTADRVVGNNTVADVMVVASHLMAGKIASANADLPGAIDWYRKAVEQQDKLIYDEPPSWPWPARETLGAAQLLANKPADAEATFKADLVRNPNNPRSLHGLAEAQRVLGKTAESQAILRNLAHANRDADVKLTLKEF